MQVLQVFMVNGRETEEEDARRLNRKSGGLSASRMAMRSGDQGVPEIWCGLGVGRRRLCDGVGEAPVLGLMDAGDWWALAGETGSPGSWCGNDEMNLDAVTIRPVSLFNSLARSSYSLLRSSCVLSFLLSLAWTLIYQLDGLFLHEYKLTEQLDWIGEIGRIHISIRIRRGGR